MAEGIERGHAPTDREGEIAGNEVRLPRGAEPPIRVFINGIEQTAGTDYEIRDGIVHFGEPLVKEGRLGGLRWLSMWLGLVGSYRKHETVDVSYRLAGRTHHASDLPVLGEGEEGATSA